MDFVPIEDFITEDIILLGVCKRLVGNVRVTKTRASLTTLSLGNGEGEHVTQLTILHLIRLSL